MICNESDGTNAADEKWTERIGGMKIYDKEQVFAALKSAGFSEAKCFSNKKKALAVFPCKEIKDSF